MGGSRKSYWATVPRLSWDAGLSNKADSLPDYSSRYRDTQKNRVGCRLTWFLTDSKHSRRIMLSACTPPVPFALYRPALMWAPDPSTRRDSVRQPFSRPLAGCPAPWSSGSHLRPCLLAPSDTSASPEPSSRHRSGSGAPMRVGSIRASHTTEAADLPQAESTYFNSEVAPVGKKSSTGR